MKHKMDILHKTHVLAISGLFVLLVLQVESHLLVKRNAWQMCDLINLYTGRTCFNYNPYGCFCGYGQQGTTPTDAADRCCKVHDDCYGDVRAVHNCGWLGMFIGYDYTCVHKTCRCTDARDVSSCGREICDCDLRLAECLGSVQFNRQYKNYNRNNCV